MYVLETQRHQTKTKMFEFYLVIIDSIAQSQEAAFQAKFNSLVYADEKLTSDEKFYLLGEMNKRWLKVASKTEKPKDN